MPAVPRLHVRSVEPLSEIDKDGLVADLRKLNYELREELGRGRSGTVYRALHIPTKMEVALKRLRALDPDDLYDLKREFGALCEIDHPNLAHIHELVVKDGHRFFTMELIDGPNLLDWIRQDSDVSTCDDHAIQRLFQSLAQLAGLLETMHSKGWVHRDIKPSNVRVSPDERIVLLDFGLMTIIGGNSPVEQNVAGTLSYMAPEAIWTTEAGAAADIYSLGVMAHECLMGRRAFVGKDLIEVDRSKRSGLPAFPPGTPSWLERLVRQMTDPNPKKRPVAAEISQVLKERTGTQAPSPIIHPPVVGREASVDALQTIAQQVDRSSPTIVRIQGASGIGKTHLVREVLAKVEQVHETTILQARCLPIATLPLPGIDGIVDALSQEFCRLPESLVAQCIPQRATELLQLFPILARVKAIGRVGSFGTIAMDLRERRKHGFNALKSLIVKLSTLRRIVIWIDDFQWCDRDSAEFWRTILLEQSSILLIVTARETESCFDLVEATNDQVVDIFLEPLPIDDVKRMLDLVVPAETDENTSIIARESRGNPFLALQIAQHTQGDPKRLLPNRSISLEGVLNDRLAGMGHEARQLLEACCLATKPIGLSTLAKATKIEAPATAVQELLRAGRLVERCSLGPTMPLVPYHDRIREAVVTSLGEQERRELHLALAETLSMSSNADPVATFWHWRGGANEEMARKYALRAGDRLMDAMAFEQAIQIYELGLEAGNAPAGDQSQIYERLGAAYEASGQGQLAGGAYEIAAKDARRAGENLNRSNDLERRSAEALLRSGFIDNGYDKLVQLLPVPKLPVPFSAMRLFAFCSKQKIIAGLRWISRLKPLETTIQRRQQLDVLWSATVGMVWADISRSAYYQAFHTRFAFAADDSKHRTRAMATESCYLAAMGPKLFRGVFEWRVKQSLQVAEESDDPNLLALALTTAATTSFLVGNWSRTVELSRQATELIERDCTTAGWELSTAYILSAFGLGIQGKLEEIESLKARAFEVARMRDDKLASTWVRVGLPNIVFLAAGKPNESRTQSREALSHWPSSIEFSLLEFWALYSEVQADLYEDKSGEARHRFEAALPRIRDSLVLYNRPVRSAFRYLDGITALAASQHTDDDTKRDHLLRATSKAARQLRRESLIWPKAMGWALHAGHCLEKQKCKTALRALLRAERCFEQTDMALFRGAAAYHHARLVGADHNVFDQAIIDQASFARSLLPLRSP